MAQRWAARMPFCDEAGERSEGRAPANCPGMPDLGLALGRRHSLCIAPGIRLRWHPPPQLALAVGEVARGASAKAGKAWRREDASQGERQPQETEWKEGGGSSLPFALAYPLLSSSTLSPVQAKAPAKVAVALLPALAESETMKRHMRLRKTLRVSSEDPARFCTSAPCRASSLAYNP